MYIVFAILLLAILIVAHEFGHFVAARIMKIDVTEFSVGFGPRLLGWNSRKYETRFSVRAIPLGGYCAFFGEDDAKGIARDDPRAFPNHNVWKRMFVILMGPVMNFVLAFLVAVVFFWCAGVSVPVDEFHPYIMKVSEGKPAQAAGIAPEDVIAEINGESMQDGTAEGTQNALDRMIQGWREGDEPLQVTVLRDGETLELSLIPERDEEGRNRIGIEYGLIQSSENRPVGFLEGFRVSWDTCVDASGAILGALKDLVTTGKGLDQTTGPVGIVSIVSQRVKKAGIIAFTELLIIISINLGLMNLLPIPGLDGSRLVFGIIEVIRGKPVPPEKEAVVHLTGMVLLFGLMIFFTYRDIVNLFH